MKLLLCDINEELVNAWKVAFDGLPDVEIIHGPFEEQDFDCMVSAANSFGLMDGGVDGAITRFFGPQLPARVQRVILDRYAGEQPVGTSFTIQTGDESKPWLAHTPTMRVPLDLRGTDNVYNAMRAMLLAVQQHNRISNTEVDDIHTVCCPGLGTMAGKVPAAIAAAQMALAYETVMFPPKRISWQLAAITQRDVVQTGAYQPPVHEDLTQHVDEEE